MILIIVIQYMILLLILKPMLKITLVFKVDIFFKYIVLE